MLPKMLKLVFVCFLLGASASIDRRYRDEYVDRLLEDVRNFVVRGGRQVKPIPALKKEYPWTFHFDYEYYSGTLNCTGGWARDISTLRRRGPVLRSNESDWMELNVAVEFTSFKFGYDRCEMSIPPYFSMERELIVELGWNSEYFSIRVKRKGDKKCAITHPGFQISEFDSKILLDDGIPQQVKEKILHTLIEESYVKRVIEDELQYILQANLATLNFC